jgi:hypothetical protein
MKHVAHYCIPSTRLFLKDIMIGWMSNTVPRKTINLDELENFLTNSENIVSAATLEEELNSWVSSYLYFPVLFL